MDNYIPCCKHTFVTHACYFDLILASNSKKMKYKFHVSNVCCDSYMLCLNNNL